MDGLCGGSWRGEERDRYRRVGVADWGHVDGWDLEEAEGARGGRVAAERPSVHRARAGDIFGWWSPEGILFWRSLLLVFLWYSKIY